MTVDLEREYIKDEIGRTVFNKLYCSDGNDYIPKDKYTIHSKDIRDLLDTNTTREVYLLSYYDIATSKYITKNVYERLDRFFKSGCQPTFYIDNEEIIKETGTGNTYYYHDGLFYKIIFDEENNLKEKHHPIKISDCPKCSSNLPITDTNSKGICTCNYCGKEVYVW